MGIILLLITAFLPASAAVCIAIKKHVPVYALAAVFCAAAVSLLPVLVLQHSVYTLLDAGLAQQPEVVQLLFNSVITAALIEEGVKAALFGLTIAIVLQKRVGITQSILLGVFFGLVFSGFENISYSLRYSNVQFIRLVTAAVLHGSLGCFYAPMVRAATKRKAALIFFVAVILHGLYNFFISQGGGFILPALAVIGLACGYAARLFTPSRP
jgi:hypothetical protein